MFFQIVFIGCWEQASVDVANKKATRLASGLEHVRTPQKAGTSYHPVDLFKLRTDKNPGYQQQRVRFKK